jgi:hypothetical protein
MITDNQRLVGIVGATNRGNKEKPMHARGVVAVILGIVRAGSASAQQSHLDKRRQIEQLAATFSERYNKQDADCGD